MSSRLVGARSEVKTLTLHQNIVGLIRLHLSDRYFVLIFYFVLLRLHLHRSGTPEI